MFRINYTLKRKRQWKLIHFREKEETLCHQDLLVRGSWLLNQSNSFKTTLLIQMSQEVKNPDNQQLLISLMGCTLSLQLVRIFLNLLTSPRRSNRLNQRRFYQPQIQRKQEKTQSKGKETEVLLILFIRARMPTESQLRTSI